MAARSLSNFPVGLPRLRRKGEGIRSCREREREIKRKEEASVFLFPREKIRSIITDFENAWNDGEIGLRIEFSKCSRGEWTIVGTTVKKMRGECNSVSNERNRARPGNR